MSRDRKITIAMIAAVVFVFGYDGGAWYTAAHICDSHESWGPGWCA